MTKADAIVQIRMLGLDGITAEDIDDLAKCDDAQLAQVLEGWRNILAAREPTAMQKLGAVLGKVADWASIAAQVVAIAAVV